MMLFAGMPFRGKELENLKEFLTRMGLQYDEGIEYSVCLADESGRISGCGSVEENVIKCVAVAQEYQGQGFLSTIISELNQYLFEKGRTHIFLYTKPGNLDIFADMGFHMIHRTEEVLLMENRAKGFSRFLQKLREETPTEAFGDNLKIGAVVANCNPFTLGHRYLLKEALKQCDYLHLFVLSDNRSTFSAKERYEMVERGIEGLERIVLHKTSDYMISAATFPTYFFKDRRQGEKANCRLDLEIFAAHISPLLHITRRFVGTEPYCKITDAYNQEMKKILPDYGICVNEIKRTEINMVPVSASEVRRLLGEGEYEKVRKLVPEGIFEYLLEHVDRKAK